MGEELVGDEESARGTLARTLRMLRERAGKSLGQLAEDASYDKSYLSRLESGERLSKRQVMVDLDAYYETGELLRDLWRLAQHDVFRAVYKDFIAYEAVATSMYKYAQAIPGLLQTEDYARSLFSMEPSLRGQVEEQVTARMSRKGVFDRESPPYVRVILDEGLLRRPVADPDVWRGQLAYFIELAETDVVVQVLPFTAGTHDLLGGSLSLLWLPDGKAVAYLEGNKFGTLEEEIESVNLHRVSYDRLRDRALSPPDSLLFIERVLKEFTA
ncbi:helix-turn-helix domain-containing protein [Streptomyces daliensis]|uniref:Helix-turn-helix domain-containing protein n=1 Tax=Streptomyces daliensis TaxID=299421 RepID=A0A8T4IKY5_9ACTN|nr:helix-turn-helix domain-containing protein [Streptomyces daliensis]